MDEQSGVISDQLDHSSDRMQYEKALALDITPETLVESQDEDEQKVKLESRKKRKDHVASLRERLYGNIGEHADTLSYYATSKQVEKAVRQKARAICRQQGIDYVDWLERQKQRYDFDSSGFTIL
jgi:hypothetical protein